MNILFFLTPKSDVAYIFENETLRQTLEKMEHRKFSCIPLLSLDGKYKGSISEGDLLWGMKTLNVPGLKEAESISIMAIPRRATYKAVHADSDMEDLLDKAINQNYVPVVDDQGYFIGIITRKEIIKYCYKELKKYISFRFIKRAAACNFFNANAGSSFYILYNCLSRPQQNSCFSFFCARSFPNNAANTC